MTKESTNIRTTDNGHGDGMGWHPVRLLAVIDTPFERVGGDHFSQSTGIRFLPFLRSLFDSIWVAAPCYSVTEGRHGYLSHAEALGLDMIELPGWASLAGFLKRLPFIWSEILRAARGSVEKADAVWLRVPSLVAVLFFLLAHKAHKLVILHVAGDPRAAWRVTRYPNWAKPLLWLGSMGVHLLTVWMSRHSLVLATGEHLLRAYGRSGRAMLFVDADVAEVCTTGRTAPSSRGFRLLYVGQLIVDKGLPVLFHALKRLSEHGKAPSLRLRVAGYGRDEQKLRAMVYAMGLGDLVEFLGPVPPGDRLRAEYLGADALVVPTTTYPEGVPRVILEAFAMGLPVIASRVAGIPGIVVHEHNGLLVAPGSVEELASAINTLRVAPRLYERLSRNAIETAMRFSPQRQVELIAQLVFGRDTVGKRSHE